PRISGATLSDGTAVPADQTVAGGPSVLFDAVALVASAEGVASLATDPAAKDFVTDAYAHCKFIGHTAEVRPLFDAAGVPSDGGFVTLGADGDVARFVDACGALRFWERAG